MVYINEAHAADGRRPVDYAKELEITEHRDYGQRCETAERLIKDKELTIPCVIDGMENLVNQAYSAHPDRIFLVRADGRLAVAGDRGPFGFEPALKETRKWLEELKKKETEPELAKDAAEAGEDRHVTPLPDEEKDKESSGKKADGEKKSKSSEDKAESGADNKDGDNKDGDE